MEELDYLFKTTGITEAAVSPRVGCGCKKRHGRSRVPGTEMATRAPRLPFLLQYLIRAARRKSGFRRRTPVIDFPQHCVHGPDTHRRGGDAASSATGSGPTRGPAWPPPHEWIAPDLAGSPSGGHPDPGPAHGQREVADAEGPFSVSSRETGLYLMSEVGPAATSSTKMNSTKAGLAPDDRGRYAHRPPTKTALGPDDFQSVYGRATV